MLCRTDHEKRRRKMEPYDQWLADNPANRKALRLFGLAALVLLLLLLFNALYVVHGTRYSEHAVTSAVTIELLRDDGSWEAAAPDRKFSAGSRVRLHVPVPAHNPAHQYTLAFTAIRAYTRVSWNGEVLAAYDESHVSRSHNFGSVPMLVEIPPKALGSSITIEEELTGRNPRPFLGDILVMPTKMSYTYYLQGEDLLFVIYHTLLMISLCAAAVLLFTRKNLMVKKGLAIALFVASFDLWSLGYHHMLGFWIKSPYLESLLEYGSLYGLPAPFLYYLYLSEKDGHRRKIYHILSLLFLALFAAALFLESLTLCTLDDILPLLHISILCAGPLVCWYQLRPLGKEKIWNVLARWSILISSGAAALVTAQYYFTSEPSLLHIRFMQALATWALLIFVLSITLSFCYQFLAQSTEAQQKKAALRLAYHDSLTGLLNHAGIFKAADKLDPKKPYSLLFMDLNGLKEVNDLQGHLSGDAFIKRMADILRSSAGDRTLCGRVGGDEFVILFPPEKAETLQPVMEKIQNKLASLQGQPHMPKDPSASFGWSIHTPSQNTSFEEHLKEADDRMYQAKEAYRKSHPLEAGRVFTREK